MSPARPRFQESPAPEPEHEELLFQSELTRVSRRRLEDGSRVICKELLGGNAEKRLSHERGILERLSGLEGVPRLACAPRLPATLVMLDQGGEPLAPLLERGVAIPALAQLGLKLARILAAVHRRGVAHRNITPANLLVREGLDPMLIDFSLATTFAEERPGFVHHRDISGNLPYLAPEQTGRTGRPVEQRADLYALGATLYQLATGRLPFEEKDPLQLIHDILARLPLSPDRHNPALPALFSELIMRLLEKEPDRRYQTAQGVAHDLSRLAEALERGIRPGFALGSRDFPLRLSPPSRLVGREGELAALGAAFQRLLAGQGGALLVTGAPGVGKTALLNELRPLVTAQRGFFAAGKFDQYRRDLASDAVYQALRALGRLLLAEPEAELQAARRRMLQSLGCNAGLVAALQPEFALLLGIVPEPLGSDPLNLKQRMIQATLDLLRSVAAPGRPLVLLLDDLQWAPPAPLGFFQAVAADPIPGLLLVGSFRDELEQAGELRLLLARRAELAPPPPLIRLENLAPDQLALFLREMLRLEPGEALGLARVLARRTGGNPYDTVELVNALRWEGALTPGEKGWSWNEPAIRRYVGRGDVAELLEERLKRLPEATRALLEVMACLGGEVAPELLARAAGVSARALQEGLAPALEDGLLLPRDVEGALRFRHDRVQQAACARVKRELKPRLHLELARRLAARPRLETQAAEQYLAALEALSEPEEKRLALSLFRGAASGTVNFEEAERFLAAALSLLNGVRLPADLPLVIALETEWHAALYSLGRLEEADRIYASIEESSRGALDRARAASLQVCSLTNRARPLEAVQLGLELLRELGIVLPAPERLHPETMDLLERFTGWIAGGAQLEERHRPESRDQVSMAAARLINRIIPPAFFCNQAMLSWWLVLESWRLWVEYGPCAALVGPLSHLGFVTISLKGDYRSGHLALRQLLELSEARGWEPDTSQARCLYALSVAPWFDPLQESVRQAQRAHDGLLRGGDLQNACFTYYASIGQLLECAPSLDSFAAQLDGALAFAARTGNTQIEASLSFHRELVWQLTGESSGAQGFSRAGQMERARIAAEGDNSSALNTLHLTRALHGALSGNAEQLARHSAALKPMLSHIRALYESAPSHLLLALSLAGQVKGGAPGERAQLLAELDQAREFLGGRAVDAPGNFLHLALWVDAERAWALGDFRGALGRFDAALQQAQTLERPWQRALLTERAALFHLESGLTHLGRLLMARARELYHRWGAGVKVRQLELQHPFLRAPRPPERDRDPELSLSADTIDMLAILRASRALSSETSLERLRSLVVQLLGTMTGATAVSLVVRQDQADDWYLLPAEFSQGEAQPVPVGEAAARGLLPVSAFHYALRTRKPLVVEDASRDDRFNQDRYLAGAPCCSLLALPVLNQGAPLAVLILENRLCHGAFTADLLDTVTLIAGQLAVSLENALLYRRLEERVRERTRELEAAQSELVDAARHAGMAEIASNVLHNVGNVLNSVNVSAGAAVQRLKRSRVAGLAQSVQLMNQHRPQLGEYLSRDDKGKLLPGYLEKLAVSLVADQQAALAELSRLVASVEHIKDIVATQQCYAGSARLVEPVRIGDLVEDALRMNQEALARHEVTVLRRFAPVPVLPLDKARLLQILVNLIANARQAMEGVPPGSRVITLALELAAGRLRISVSDVGEGIAPENLSRIFSHGFTTRKGGHGFGLHSCALAAREMGGALAAHSAGAGRGACFVLELPVPSEEVSHEGN